LNFLERFFENPQVSNFMKIRPVEAELFRVDGQTDRSDEANLAFRNFAKAPYEQNLVAHNVFSDILINNKKIKIATHVRWQHRA